MPPPSTAPPTLTGAALTAGMDGYAYLVGGLGADARRAATARTRKKAPEPEGADAPAVAAAPEERAASPRRRRAKLTQPGRGYEYMDLEPEPAPSASGAGALGFVGTAARDGSSAAGLATLPAAGGGAGGPSVPMLPGTWEAGPD
ncbi:hypothetical protein BST11_18705 [Mycobacterium alsense]|nr:hypothetical protein BST11_18705 [Mycobacterium alsense]